MAAKAAKGENQNAEKLSGDVGRTQERVRANGRSDGIGKTRMCTRVIEPVFSIGSDLTNTIRARGQERRIKRPDIRQYQT